MTRKYRFLRRQDVKKEILKKILRNSTRICQFIGANLEDKVDEVRNVRNLPEDGVYLYIIEDLEKTLRFVLHNETSTDDEDEDEYDEDDWIVNEDGGTSPAVNVKARKNNLMLISRLRYLLRNTLEDQEYTGRPAVYST